MFSLALKEIWTIFEKIPEWKFVYASFIIFLVYQRDSIWKKKLQLHSQSDEMIYLFPLTEWLNNKGGNFLIKIGKIVKCSFIIFDYLTVLIF